MTEFLPLESTLREFTQRGDLAHLALLSWVVCSTVLLVWALREITAAHRRYEKFVNELARLNKLFEK